MNRSILRNSAFLLLMGLNAGCVPKRAYPDGNGLEGQLEREILALRAQVVRLETNQSCGKGPDLLYTELNQVLSPKDTLLEYDGPITTITLRENILFGSDEYSIRQEARMALDLIATALNAHAKHRIVVEGHTADTPGSTKIGKAYPNPWDLGYVRASAVASVLIQNYKLDSTRLTVATRGDSEPIASNDTPAGQVRNRRVVLRIYPPGVSH
jgi:flagellar motor protein MotB